MTANPYAELVEWQVAPITALVGSLVAGVVGALNSIIKKNEKDDEHV